MPAMNEKQPFDENISNSGLTTADFSIGDRVQVICKQATYSWGSSVKRGDVGVVKEFDVGRVRVKFNTHSGWLGEPHEFINLTRVEALAADFEAMLGLPKNISLSVDDLIKETRELQEQFLTIQAKLSRNKRTLRDTYQLEII